MNLELEVQHASNDAVAPPEQHIRLWAERALVGRRERAALVVRSVDEAEGARLNQRYRQRQGPTNVLSFPCELPCGIETDFIGDLVICAPIVEREAAEQGKLPEAHWAHMVVHGVLHLLGYDHQCDHDAAEMEGLETTILTGLGFAAPYEDAGLKPRNGI